MLPLDVTTPLDSYAWNYRVLAPPLTLSESLAEVGLEPLTIGSMRKDLPLSNPDTLSQLDRCSSQTVIFAIKVEMQLTDCLKNIMDLLVSS